MPGSGGRIGPPRRSTKLVVLLGGHFTGHVILQVHRLLFRRDSNHLTARSHIDGKLVTKRLFRRHQETRFFFNRAPDMVGQPTVRVRNIRAAFDHEDFDLFVQPAQPRGTRCSARHSSNDDDFHFFSPEV